MNRSFNRMADRKRGKMLRQTDTRANWPMANGADALRALRPCVVQGENNSFSSKSLFANRKPKSRGTSTKQVRKCDFQLGITKAMRWLMTSAHTMSGSEGNRHSFLMNRKIFIDDHRGGVVLLSAVKQHEGLVKGQLKKC